jgi:diguanylate cyclase (GGDEF)-like protein
VDAGLGLTGAVLGGVSVYLANRGKSSPPATKQQSLEQQDEHFRAAMESSPNAFYIVDSVRDEDGRIVDFTLRYLNLQAEQRLKCKRSEVIGTSCRRMMESIHPDYQFDRYCEAVNTGEPITLEFPVNVPGSRFTWLRHQVVKLGDGLAVTSTDLSELKTAQQRFESVAEFSDMIFEQAPFSIIATDAHGTITAVNLEAEKLTGYSSGELIHTASFLLLHDPEELKQRAARIHSEQGIFVEGLDLIAGRPGSAQGAKGAETIQDEVWTFIRRDGTRLAVNLAVKVLRDAAGERTGIIAIASDVSASKPTIGHLSLGTTHDPLTGLIGHSLLEDRIAQAIKRSKRAATKVAVFTIDLDHFKRINDSLGHRIGDEILTVAATRLTEKVRSADTVARLSGDEFIVVVSDQLKISDVEFCAEQLLRAISAPYAVHGHTINVTASVGICLYPDFAGDTEHLLRRSEAAMYSAKEMGRNRAALFSSSMLEDASSRLSMEGALRQALDRNELFLEYQPQVALPSGKVIGMEALLRWRHSRFGLVSPAHFIPIAEKIGILTDFGEWAMRQACRDAKWIQTRLGRSVSLSVNLSPNQFEQKRLLRTIEEALQVSGLPASDLEIEIIENTLMINSTANLKTLQMIRDLGVRLSIDDFGTGFCNFNYLLQYQVDRLKIDQSFVRQAANDTNAASVVRTVIAMSHGLGVKVIAEGVETREQLKFLMRRRCDQAQGYFFARPLSPEHFVDSVAVIEAMNLGDPSGETIAGRVDADEASDFLSKNAPVLQPLASS